MLAEGGQDGPPLAHVGDAENQPLVVFSFGIRTSPRPVSNQPMAPLCYHHPFVMEVSET